jgi:hypothetical protein
LNRATIRLIHIFQQPGRPGKSSFQEVDSRHKQHRKMNLMHVNHNFEKRPIQNALFGADCTQY